VRRRIPRQALTDPINASLARPSPRMQPTGRTGARLRVGGVISERAKGWLGRSAKRELEGFTA
jgi:hypothetical protein